MYRRFPNQTLAALQRLIPPLGPDDSVLDVGCGAGSLLHALGEAGFRKLLGIDPFNKSDLTYPNGVRIANTRLDDLEGQWDVIMFNHSFEHELHPFETLEHVRRLLSPGGRCVIRIPVSSSWAWQHYRTDWVQLDAPRHMFLHSKQSMDIIAAKAGLAISEITYESTSFQFWGSEQIRKGISLFSDPRSYAVHPRTSSFTRETIREFERKATELNAAKQGDQASFLLKPSSQ